MNGMAIGTLAKRTGTKVNTVRFYEEIGLLPRAARTESGRRTYGLPDLNRLSFIRNARGLGFSIDQIRSLLALAGEEDQDCSTARDLANRHLLEVENRLEQLSRLRKELKRIARSCDGGKVSDCRIIEAIAKPLTMHDDA